MTRTLAQVLFGFCLLAGTVSGSALGGSSTAPPQPDEPPVIPIGLDAYRQWDRLPYHRIGLRAYMRSTYDRQGNNRTADASHFLYQARDDFNVTLDVKGPGVLYFMRTNHWHGSPWHYEIDGNDFVVRETATENPVDAKKRLSKTVFLPEDLFPNPLTWTWTTTHGADLMWVPLPFQDSLRIAYGRTFYGTGYYIYHLVAPGTEHLSRPLESWGRTPPDRDVLDLIRRSGTDIAPKGPDVSREAGRLSLQPHEKVTLAEMTGPPRTIRALKFTVPREKIHSFGKNRLLMTWDRRWNASVDAPLELFFAAGHFYNPDDREYLVKGFPISVRYEGPDVVLSCFYPMPFFRHARIELEEMNGESFTDIRYEIRSLPLQDPASHVAYFHATYTDHPHPVEGQDVVFLDTAHTEGGGEWSGNFVGMSWIFSRNGVLSTLEGDPRFFFDGSKTPQGWGTGTEEWAGGGDYWGGRNMTLPFAGHPLGKNRKEAQSEEDLINSAYRFLIADLFPFGNRAVIGLEHGGLNNSVEHYSGVVYWYGIDSPTLVLTDELNACHKDSIEAHEYDSPTAQEPYELVSRYEWGADGEPAGAAHPGSSVDPEHQYFPAEKDRVRIMRGTSRFVMKLDSDNQGALLRRKFDYAYPNQRAAVWVRPGGEEMEWNYVGEWYTSGSNTCVHSNPREGGELAPAEHHIITSNRRWREEEFLIPRHLTRGVERLEIKIEHLPDQKELFPGHPFPYESAWSEARYWMFSYKLPNQQADVPR